MIFLVASAVLGALFLWVGKESDVKAFNSIDTGSLYPPFFAKVESVVAACRARGVDYVVTSGLRSYESQDEIYAQGRTVDGVVVTNARGGQSQHNFGIAVDFARVKNGVKSWGARDFDVLIEEVKRAGLHTGENYNDKPHVGWPEYFRGGELAVLDSVYRRRKDMLDVWRFLDSTRGVA